MDKSYLYLRDLIHQMTNIPDNSIVSRTVYNDEQIKVTLFGFAAGQELTDHTASHPAVLHFLQGEALLVLGEEQFEAGPGTWVHMPANLSHSLTARTQLFMLLTLLKSNQG